VWGGIVNTVNYYCCMQDEQTQVCGIVVIENMADVGLLHARSIDRRAAKLFTSLIQVALPLFVARCLKKNRFNWLFCNEHYIVNAPLLRLHFRLSVGLCVSKQRTFFIICLHQLISQGSGSIVKKTAHFAGVAEVELVQWKRGVQKTNPHRFVLIYHPGNMPCPWRVVFIYYLHYKQKRCFCFIFFYTFQSYCTTGALEIMLKLLAAWNCAGILKS